MGSFSRPWSHTVVLVLALSLLATSTFAAVPGLKFDRHPESKITLAGAEVVLECALTVSADKIEWKLNGTLLSPPANRASGRLLVKLGRTEEEYRFQTGNYQCVAWFGASAMASLPANVQVAYIEEPEKTANTSNIQISSGNVVSMSCPLPRSSPPAQLSFRRDGNYVSAPVSDSGTLLLSNVTPSDNGRYTCSARNVVTGEVVTIPANFQLKVDPPGSRNVAPYFPLPKLTNYTVRAGQEATLECPAAGWPPPSFTWTKYGGTLPTDRTVMISGALILSSVGRADEGTYVCEAKNSAGNLAKCVISLQINEPPTMVQEPSSKTVEEGGDLNLNCSAKGFPVPIITWVQNGESVDRDPKVSTQGGRLTIKQVEKRHAGIYQCFATNSLGSAFGLAMLQVQPKTINSRPMMEDSNGDDDIDDRSHGRGHGRFDRKKKNKGRAKKLKGHSVMIPPTSPNITRLSDESVMVTWDVHSDEGLPIQFFKVQYKDVERGRWNTIDEDIPLHVRSYEVDNLKTDHSYKFRISAVYSNNDNKQGPNSVKFHLQKEQTTKKPLYTPVIVNGEATSPSAITINWDYSPVPSVPIEGFFIYYRSATMAGDYTKATVMGEHTRSFLITHLLPDNSYDIKIQAFNSAGTSGFSDLRYYRTLYVATTEEPVSDLPMPGGGGLGGVMGSEAGSQSIGLVLGIVIGGLFLLVLILCLGVYFCKHSNSRTAASDLDPAKEAQAYGLVAVGKPITNGSGHHHHQIRHNHRHQQRVHITANPLASNTDHYKSETELELPSQNNNCSDPARRRLRTTSIPTEEDEGPNDAGGSSEEEHPPPMPPRQLENYV